MSERNLPGLPFWSSAQAINGAGAPVEQSAGNPCIAQQLGCTFDGVALSNRSEVEHNAWSGESDGQVFGVQLNEVGADSFSSQNQLFWPGLPTGPTYEAPTANQRGHRNVEGALGLVAEL